MGINLIAAALALTGMGSLAASAQGNGPSPPSLTDTADKPETLLLEQERYERLTVPVTISGQGPFRFMVDTGAQATVLSHQLAERLQLFDRKPAILVGMASRVPIETVGLDNLSFGSRSFYIQAAPVIDSAHLGSLDGILGLDSLQHQRILLDFDKREITVSDGIDQPTSNTGFDIVVKARERLGQLIITKALVDGIETSVIVDTGAQSSIGNPALLDRLRRARSMGDTEVTDVSGNSAAGAVRLVQGLSIGDVNIQSLPVVFLDSPSFHSLKLANRPALILGMRELRLFRRVAIDFRTRQVLFDLPRGTSRFNSAKGGRFTTG